MSDADALELRTPLDICTAAVGLLQVSGGGMSVMTSAGAMGTVCSTDPVAAAIEELQFTLGEGPCVDAFRAGPVLIDDLDDARYRVHNPWPQFAAAASQAGARALFAFPLQIGAIRVGAFDVYRATPGPLSSTQLSWALRLADVAAGSLLAAQFHDQLQALSGPGADTPALPLESFHAEVHQATGMVSVQLGVSLDEAFVRLRARAYATERPLNDLAKAVVDGTLTFDSRRRGDGEPAHD